jgi:hypothetical protein
MFGDIAEDFRQYMDAVNMTEIREQWDKYQSPAARRLSGVTIEDANGSRKVDLSTKDGVHAPEKKQSTCEGPRVRLEFVPKKCVVVDHELECLPAKLVLKKRAGRCIMKHLSPAKYKHKECKLEKKWGKDEEKLYGGDSYMAGHVSDQVSDALGGVSRTQ